jgi:hypothetical protein
MSKRFTHVSGAVVAAVAVLAAASMAGGASAALATDPARAAVRPTLAPAFSGRLYGVTALSATDAWAVGLYPTGALILHWNGKTWTSHDISGCCFLESVAATSPANAWAVGGTGWFTTEPLIEHWNDRAWTKASVQAPAAGGYLNGVAVVSASDAWAVGWTGGGPGDGTGPGDATLIEHWNGRAWTRVRTQRGLSRRLYRQLRRSRRGGGLRPQIGYNSVHDNRSRSRGPAELLGARGPGDRHSPAGSRDS